MSPNQNLVGAMWMMGAMALFAVEDALVKTAYDTLPIGQILILFGLGGSLVFSGVLWATRQPLMPIEILSRPMRWRVLFEITGRLFFVLAITLTPLSSATVILQATPLVVVACAALFLRERVGPRRWSAIALGMVGVLIILRPGPEGFSYLSLLAFVAMLGFAGRDLASRAAPKSLGPATLGLYGFLPVLVTGLMYSLWEGRPLVVPDVRAGLCAVGFIIAGVLAYGCLMRAMRTGDVSAVTPFRYTRLIFGIALGVLVFGETLTGPMLLGSALIVLSGVFVLSRS